MPRYLVLFNDARQYWFCLPRSGGSADNIVKTVTLNLSSEALNGTWKLRVNDAYSGDTGYINSWSITF